MSGERAPGKTTTHPINQEAEVTQESTPPAAAAGTHEDDVQQEGYKNPGATGPGTTPGVPPADDGPVAKGDYDKASPEELQAETDRRGVTPEKGSGANRNVVKADLVKALEEDDAKP